MPFVLARTIAQQMLLCLVWGGSIDNKYRSVDAGVKITAGADADFVLIHAGRV